MENNEENRNCMNTTWMQSNNISSWWTLSPRRGINYNGFIITSAGGGTYVLNNETVAVRPSVYLSSKIKITEGDGSQNNPYRIE